MARRLPPCHCPEWLATVEDIGQIYGWWLGEVELTFDPLSTLPLSVYPWREAPTMPLPRVAGDCIQGTRTGILFSHFRPLSPSHAQSEEANSPARRLSSRMRNVATFKLRVKLLNLQGRI